MSKYFLLASMIFLGFGSAYADQWQCSAYCGYYGLNQSNELGVWYCPTLRTQGGSTPEQAFISLDKQCKMFCGDHASAITGISVDQQSVSFATLATSCTKVDGFSGQ